MKALLHLVLQVRQLAVRGLLQDRPEGLGCGVRVEAGAVGGLVARAVGLQVLLVGLQGLLAEGAFACQSGAAAAVQLVAGADVLVLDGLPAVPQAAPPAGQVRDQVCRLARLRGLAAAPVCSEVVVGPGELPSAAAAHPAAMVAAVNPKLPGGLGLPVRLQGRPRAALLLHVHEVPVGLQLRVVGQAGRGEGSRELLRHRSHRAFR